MGLLLFIWLYVQDLYFRILAYQVADMAPAGETCDPAFRFRVDQDHIGHDPLCIVQGGPGGAMTIRSGIFYGVMQMLPQMMIGF